MTYRIAVGYRGEYSYSYAKGLSRSDAYKKLAYLYQGALYLAEEDAKKGYNYVVEHLSKTKKGVVNGFVLTFKAANGEETSTDYRVRVDA